MGDRFHTMTDIHRMTDIETCRSAIGEFACHVDSGLSAVNVATRFGSIGDRIGFTAGVILIAVASMLPKIFGNLRDTPSDDAKDDQEEDERMHGNFRLFSFGYI
jgi:hypothetical protein